MPSEADQSRNIDDLNDVSRIVYAHEEEKEEEFSTLKEQIDFLEMGNGSDWLKTTINPLKSTKLLVQQINQI